MTTDILNNLHRLIARVTPLDAMLIIQTAAILNEVNL
jgi:hypothetical protein